MYYLLCELTRWANQIKKSEKQKKKKIISDFVAYHKRTIYKTRVVLLFPCFVVFIVGSGCYYDAYNSRNKFHM